MDLFLYDRDLRHKRVKYPSNFCIAGLAQFPCLVVSFLANVPILYSLQMRENQRFSGVFTEYKMGTLARNVLDLNPTFLLCCIL